jgi:hypothetical protein
MVAGVLVALGASAGCEATPMQKQINASTARHNSDEKREAEGSAGTSPENGPGAGRNAAFRVELRGWARTAMEPLDEVVVSARNSAMRSKPETKADFEKALQLAEVKRTAIHTRIEGIDALDEPSAAVFKMSLQSQLDELKTLVEPLRPR